MHKYFICITKSSFHLTYSPFCGNISAISDESEYNAVFSEIRSGRYDRLYASAGFDPVSYNEITVSISILQPELFLRHAENSSCLLIAGIRHTDALIRAFNEDSIDLDRFFEHCCPGSNERPCYPCTESTYLLRMAQQPLF